MSPFTSRTAFAVASVILVVGQLSADPLLTKKQIAQAAAKIESCLTKQLNAAAGRGDSRKCIGLIEGDCEDKISAGGEAAHATCSDNETAAWDALLNKAWADMPTTLTPERFAVLKEVQRQWLAYRKAKCAFLNDMDRPGAWGLMLEADCLKDETARRTLELRDILTDPNLGGPE